MPPDEALDERGGDRRGVIGVLQRAEPGARIVDPGLVAGVRQLGEAVMLPQRDGIRRRRDTADRAGEHPAAEPAAAAPTAAAPAASRATALIRERQDRVDLGVLWESLGPRHVD